jgi:hypothetical protein
MNVGQLVDVRSFPAVVQVADVQALRHGKASDGSNAAVRDFVGGYLGFDERSRYALDTTLQSLAQNERGGAFFINGVFGSGKSHLLGLLALLADGIGHTAFQETHPALTPLVAALPRRLVIHFSLDNYDAARFSLEDIFWRELRLEWQQRGLEPHDIAMPEVGSRAEYFAALDEALRRHELHGLVLCLDELSLFLSAKEHRALQSDAAFLQFLGQRAARAPLWVFTAIQKTIEDIGELETYSLAQIRDRFTTLPLSLTHVPSLIKHRLIICKDAAALHHLCQESFDSLQKALPRLDFGRTEWEELYPFHPATILLLEQVVSRFLSRTRSAVLFCTGAARAAIAAAQPAAERILPDALFDYLAPELETHPDFRPLAAMWSAWQADLPELATDRHDTTALTRLMKCLLLFKIAGLAPTATQLANAIALDAQLPGDGNYDYARVLLERLRTQGSYLTVERREGDLADRYTIDLGTRIGELARRHTRNAITTLPAHDARITRYAVSCCRDEPLPLATLDGTRCCTLMWRNAPRQLDVEIVSAILTAQGLANRIAMLAQPGHPEDALLLIAPPFTDRDEPTRSLVADTAALLTETRWRAALLLWMPRRATHDEAAFTREATAQHLLESDPQLLDNRRGRAILQHLKENAPQRETALARLTVRLLREGQLITAAGLAVDAAELAGTDSWLGTLEAIGEFALPHLFPYFEAIAPRLRVLTSSNCDALCLEILRRPAGEPFFSASLERTSRAIAEPLGVARLAQGRWRISPPRDDLSAAIKALVPETGAPLAAIEAQLMKSEWGLRAEQIHVVLCALLRDGELAATDTRGQLVPPEQIGMPLRRAVHAVRPGRLVTTEQWHRVQQLVGLLCDEQLETLSYTEQERARSLLVAWRDEATAETELAQARLHQLRRALGHNPAQWPRAEAALEKIATLLAQQDAGTAVELLTRAAAIDIESLRPALAEWRALLDKLEEQQAALLTAHSLLRHLELSIPTELQDTRTLLLERFDAGEDVLNDDTLRGEATAWRAAYAAQYREWHAAQHAPERWTAYRRLATGETMRALEALSTLTSRRFEHADALRVAIDAEMDKSCARDGHLPHDSAVCNHCRLRFGERLRLRDPRELEALAAQGIAALRSTLQEPPVHDYLSRANAHSLLEWSDGTEDGVGLLPLLTPEILATLNEALRPRRCVTRSIAALEPSLRACNTVAELRRSFETWLDAGENLSDDDELHWE